MALSSVFVGLELPSPAPLPRSAGLVDSEAWPAPALPRARPAHSISAAPCLRLQSRRRGDWFLLRIDDTDRSREVEARRRRDPRRPRMDRVTWNDDPVRQSERAERHREAAAVVGKPDADGSDPLRTNDAPPAGRQPDVSPRERRRRPRLRDHARDPREPTTARTPSSSKRLSRALGFEPPEYVHHGLLLGPDGKKLRNGPARRRSPSLPGSRHACGGRARVPRGARRAGARRPPRRAADPSPRDRRDRVAQRRGARGRAPARRLSWHRRCAERAISSRRGDGSDHPRAAAGDAAGSCAPDSGASSAELRANGLDGKDIVRELKAVGGDLKALRLALTGVERGPELWTVIAALPQDEALRRVDAAL